MHDLFPHLFFYSIYGELADVFLYDEYVRDHVPPEKVAFIDGLDQAETLCRTNEKLDFTKLCNRGHKLFTREAFKQHDDRIRHEDISVDEFSRYEFDAEEDLIDLSGWY